MARLYANPYDISANGFYFDSFEEFEKKAKNLRNWYGQPVEEFEIVYIDGDNPNLFVAAKINQANLETWYDELDHIDDDSDEGLAIRYLLEKVGLSLEDALNRYQEVQIYRGRIEDYAADLIEECYDLPEFALRYFDYDSFARDMIIAGDVAEIQPGVWCVNATEF